MGSPITVFGSGLRGIDAVRRPDGGLLLAAVGGGTPRAVYSRTLAADGTLGPQTQVDDRGDGDAAVPRSRRSRPTARC